MKSLKRYFQRKQIRRLRDDVADLCTYLTNALANIMGAIVAVETQTIDAIATIRMTETAVADVDDKVELLTAKIDALALAVEAIGNPNVEGMTERLEEVRVRLAAAVSKVAANTEPPPPPESSTP